MGVYLLLAVSGLALTASFLHTGGADHGPAHTDRLDKLEQALEKETELRRKLEVKFQRDMDAMLEQEQKLTRKLEEFESEQELCRNEKLLWGKEKEELKETVMKLKESLNTRKCPPNKTPEGYHVGVQRELYDADSPDTLDIKSRADDTGGWEPVVGQISQQLNHLTADVQAIKNVNTQQDQAIQESRVSVFVRWGRSVCPTSNSLVYSGAVGGSWWSHRGAASNYLCLSMSPVFGSHSLPSEMALLYGGEYQTADSHHDDNVPCAVCRSARPTTMMVPGTNQCPSGWTLEYGGFLMANHYGHQASSEYVCLDADYEDRPGGGANEDGKLFFFTLTRCGSLPCPPYEENKIVTCAVCSK